MEDIKEKTANAVEDKKKPTYEELKNWCDQLLMQRNQIAERYNQVTDVLNKLPWLFKVVEHESAFNAGFVNQCIEEITFIMTPPPAEEEKTEEPKE